MTYNHALLIIMLHLIKYLVSTQLRNHNTRAKYQFHKLDTHFMALLANDNGLNGNKQPLLDSIQHRMCLKFYD